jgi:REP element-mobilizing transposase RayT
MERQVQGHHRRSIRLPGYDYTTPGAYFITICTRQHACLLGEITNSQIQGTPLGYLAQQQWLKLPTRFPHIQLDAFIVMPNHMHGILIIPGRGMGVGIRLLGDQTHPHAPTSHEQFGQPVPGSIPTIIRSYKASVALRSKYLANPPTTNIWQRNYWEHIIRDEAEWVRIRDYIQTNPAHWEEDRFAVGARG